MDNLIKIQDNNMVNAKELYAFLEVVTPYRIWFPRMCEYGFVEGADFSTKMYESSNGGRPSEYNLITIEMAKEISMIQRNEKGKQARQYFIECEKKLKSNMQQIPQTFSEALQLAADQAKKIEQQNKEIEQSKPKVLFADSVSASKTNILIGELAKLIKQNGFEIGQNRLFQWLRDNNYLISRKSTDYNMPTQKSMNLGLFKIKETSITHSDGHVSVNKTVKVTGKGQIYFINTFLGKE